MPLSHITGIDSNHGPELAALALAVNAIVDQVNAGSSLAAIADQNLLANTSGGSAAPVATSLSALLDYVLGSTRGTVIYRGASAWSALPAGSAGQVLTAQGAAADPHWVTPAAAAATVSEWAYSAFDGV